MHSSKDLTFAVVDDLAFAAATNGHSAVAEPFESRDIGPFVEFTLLRWQGRLADGVANMVEEGSALRSMTSSRSRNVVVELGRHAGFMRLTRDTVAETELTKLSVVTKRAALSAGFGDRSAGQLSAALGELLSNVVEHSQARDTGLVGYQALDGCFEFVVADQGIGALQSLRRNERFAMLASDREALPLALKAGCSRFNDPGRGHGFDDIFRGLANHKGSLRFRSGDAAVLIDGSSPSAIKPKVKKKPHLQGFLASISCSP